MLSERYIARHPPPPINPNPPAMIYGFILGFLFSALLFTYSVLIKLTHKWQGHKEVLQKLWLSVHHVVTERLMTEKTQANALTHLVNQIDNIETMFRVAKEEQNIEIVGDIVNIVMHLDIILQILKAVNKEVGEIKEVIGMMEQDWVSLQLDGISLRLIV